jgi:hypothetical protein
VSDGKPAATAGTTKATSSTLPVWPTPIPRLNQGVRPGHIAWDIDAELGDPVRAMVAGIVQAVIPNEPSGYGNLVIIRDGAGNQIYYGHNSAFAVRPGDPVQAGQLLALAGSSGNSTGTHVHLEIRNPSGQQIDPSVYFGGARFQQIMTRASELAGTLVRSTAGSYQALQPTSAAIPVEQLRRPQPATSAPATAIAEALPEDEAPESEARVILETPLGNVTVPAFEPGPWANVGALGAGAVLSMIGLVFLARPFVEQHKEDIVKLAGLAAKAALPVP